jgi:hypothetical protein
MLRVSHRDTVVSFAGLGRFVLAMVVALATMALCSCGSLEPNVRADAPDRTVYVERSAAAESTVRGARGRQARHRSAGRVPCSTVMTSLWTSDTSCAPR